MPSILPRTIGYRYFIYRCSREEFVFPYDLIRIHLWDPHLFPEWGSPNLPHTSRQRLNREVPGVTEEAKLAVFCFYRNSRARHATLFQQHPFTFMGVTVTSAAHGVQTTSPPLTSQGTPSVDPRGEICFYRHLWHILWLCYRWEYPFFVLGLS